MPKRYTVHALERLCMSNIAGNINGWTKNYEENYMGKGIYRFILGPFDTLGTHMAEELTNLLIEEKKITKAALHLLLNGGQFRHLNLSTCAKLVTDDVVHIISARCKKLKSLNLAGCKRISQQALCILAKCLHNVISLDLSYTRVDRQVMQQILSNSQQLMELKVRKSGISDADLADLCWMASERPSEMKLLHLDISQTYVTKHGVSEVISNMPQLQAVLYPGIFECLFEPYLPHNYDDEDRVEQEDIEMCIAKVMSDEALGKYQMRSLLSEDFTYTPNAMLVILPLLCPLITHVDLKLCTGFDDAGLKQLSGLVELRQLELCCQHDDRSNITFDGGVVPLLSERGRSIQKLALHDIDKTDPLTVCSLCPNLRGLNIFMMHDQAHFFSSAISQHPAHICQCLQDLSIWSKHADLSLSLSNLTQILSCSQKLKKLNLIRTDTLTDYVLLEVMQRNPLAELEDLTLHECNAVSGEVMTQFLFNDANSSLQTVKLMSCRETTRRDFTTWKRMAKNEHYDMTIEWK